MESTVKRTPESGVGFIEVMMAVGVLTIALMALGMTMVHGLSAMFMVQEQLIAKQKAREALESVFTSRSTQNITFDQIRNVGVGGIFLEGFQSVRGMGVDGIANTGDDSVDPVETVLMAGPDGVLNTADDVRKTLNGFQRSVAIANVLLQNGLVDPDVRTVTVVVRFRAQGRWENRNIPKLHFEVRMKHARKSDSGFSIVEFAVSTLAAMALLAATFTLMGTTFRSNNQMGDMMAAQQNVRVAMNTIARDITMAGTGLPTAGVAVPNGTGSSPIIRPGMGSFSAPDRNIATPNDVIPMISPANDSGPTVAGADTDALTIFSLNQESPTWTVNTIAVFSDRYEIQFFQNVSTGATQLFPGDVLLINNFNGSVLACVSDISEETNTLAFFRNEDLMGVNQPGAASGNITSLANDPLTPTVFPPTTAVRVNIINYYISTANPAHPRLMRAVDTGAPQVLAEDIESLQFTFDLFDFATSTENSNQATTTSPNQVRAVNVFIGGRSREKLERSNDFFRFSLVSKINVRNASFRNRYSGS